MNYCYISLLLCDGYISLLLCDLLLISLLLCDALIATFPYCGVNFKSYSKIEGMVLLQNRGLRVEWYGDLGQFIYNKNAELKHEKGKQKSFESRNIRGGGGGGYPVSISKLASLDEKSFSMGNLRDVPQSKSVVLRLKVLFPYALNLH